MSIQTEITRLQTAKADIKTAIELKGVNVPSSATIDTYDGYVSQIVTGGGGSSSADTALAGMIDGSLTEIVIPSGVTEIRDYVFRDCSDMTSVTIPNSVTIIGNYAFYRCSGLTSVNIPDSVTKIENYAFRGCSALTSVTILSTTPPTLYSHVFDDTNNCPIYVPAESVETYKAAINWSDYASRIQAIPSS